LDGACKRIVYGDSNSIPLYSVIRDMLRLENALDECLESLKSRLDRDFSYRYDDFDDYSIASGGVGSASASMSNRVVRFTVQERQVEKLQAELAKVERDNVMLREEVAILKRRFLPQDEAVSEEKKGEDKEFNRVELSDERGVWNVVKQLNFQNGGGPNMNSSK
jgi:hypothetical protein